RAVAKATGRAFGRGTDAVDVAAAKAGQERGIDVPRAIVGGPKDRNKAATLLKGGPKQLIAAHGKMLDQSAAKPEETASSVGTPAASAVEMAAAGLKAGNQASKNLHPRIGTPYPQADDGTTGV